MQRRVENCTIDSTGKIPPSFFFPLVSNSLNLASRRWESHGVSWIDRRTRSSAGNNSSGIISHYRLALAGNRHGEALCFSPLHRYMSKNAREEETEKHTRGAKPYARNRISRDDACALFTLSPLAGALRRCACRTELLLSGQIIRV